MDVAEAGIAAGVNLALLLRDVMAGGAPTSPSHDIVAAPTPGGLEVTLGGEGARLDRDVVVRWPAAGHETGLTLDTGRPASDRPHASAAYGLLTVVPPLLEGVAHVMPRDLILLIDTSGSMGGDPLEQAKAVARALVESLDVWDQLELIQFSSRPRRWRRRAESATEAVRRDAVAWLGALVAEGGTEMRDGVMEALRPLRTGRAAAGRADHRWAHRVRERDRRARGAGPARGIASAHGGCRIRAEPRAHGARRSRRARRRGGDRPRRGGEAARGEAPRTNARAAADGDQGLGIRVARARARPQSPTCTRVRRCGLPSSFGPRAVCSA